MVKTSAMREADLQYIRNINTKPGPNAGRSIDPAKPGPDDEERQNLVVKLYQAKMASHSFQTLHDLCDQAVDEIEWLVQERDEARAAVQALINAMPHAQSDAKRIVKLEAECGRLENDLFEARAALAQSDAGPDDDEHKQLQWVYEDAVKFCEIVFRSFNLTPERIKEYADTVAAFSLHTISKALTLAQSDAERILELEAECGRLENELFEARAALAQSDAGPVAWQFRTTLSGDGKWSFWFAPGKPDLDPEFYEVRPLYVST